MWKGVIWILLISIVSFLFFTGGEFKLPSWSSPPAPKPVPVVIPESQTPNGASPPQTKPKAPRSERASDAQIDRFLKWVFKHGAEFKYNVTLSKIPGFGLGLMAHERVPKGAEYLKLSYDLLIGEENILSDPKVGHVFSNLREDFGPNIKYEITLFLLYHKHVVGPKKSFYGPFFDILPTEFDVPIFWSPEKLSYLRGSDLHRRVLQQKQRFRRQYEGLVKSVLDNPKYSRYFPKKKIPFEEFLWVHWIYSSRLFFIEERSPREHLLPLADMVNCFEPNPREENLVFVRDTGKYLQLVADRAFQAGTQIFESYGYKSNAESFQYEGFILDNTPNDCVWFFLPYKGEAKEKFRYQTNPEFCFSASDLSVGKFPGRSIEYLRWFVSETDQDRSAQGYRSKQNEKKVLELLLKTVDEKIAANPYDASPTKTKILAIRFMKFEKTQLLRIREVVSDRLKRFQK